MMVEMERGREVLTSTRAQNTRIRIEDAGTHLRNKLKKKELQS
ncbi:hypothetical protein LINGRAHAP2_LOCUS15602 [Linum grandiflorum]